MSNKNIFNNYFESWLFYFILEVKTYLNVATDDMMWSTLCSFSTTKLGRGSALTSSLCAIGLMHKLWIISLRKKSSEVTLPIPGIYRSPGWKNEQLTLNICHMTRILMMSIHTVVATRIYHKNHHITWRE